MDDKIIELMGRLEKVEDTKAREINALLEDIKAYGDDIKNIYNLLHLATKKNFLVSRYLEDYVCNCRFLHGDSVVCVTGSQRWSLDKLIIDAHGVVYEGSTSYDFKNKKYCEYGAIKPCGTGEYQSETIRSLRAILKSLPNYFMTIKNDIEGQINNLEEGK